MLEGILDKTGFADEAIAWMLEEYGKVVVALKGVESADQIKKIEKAA
ncbi:MAG: hypothetical protein ABFQ62_02515 [Patescibacteria group bacterium]